MPVRTAEILLAWRRPLAAFLLATLLAAAAYVYFAEDRYEAEAKLQVVPVAATDRTFEGFSVLREGEDEKTPAQTAVDLVESSDVVDAVASRLGRDRDDLVDAVSADAAGASNVVTVRARWSSPQTAAQIANAFADEFVARRSSQFQADLTRTIERLRDVPGAEARVETLEAYEGLPDPTVEVAGDAVAPESSVSQPALVVLGGALLAALLLALAAAAGVAVVRRPLDERRGVADERDTWLAARERAAESRERELQDRAAAAADAEAERQRAATESTRERERELRQRADELAARQQAAEARDRALDAYKATLDERAEQLERELATAHAPATDAVPEADSGQASSLMLPRLERLLREHGEEFPERVDEWRAYLFHLRDHATPEGELSPSHEALAAEVFADLLDAPER
ncbi:MAG TPA: Wzz/FepE/Etk N-terminal domain-containing protein [Gaiellaceae bacterium]|nr:Wzz/FepE/Etk N-terminal domain-containing protein [Gaiellaceae bacterium]